MTIEVLFAQIYKERGSVVVVIYYATCGEEDGTESSTIEQTL